MISNSLDLEVFIPLLAAHLITDFLLQSDKSVRNKRTFRYFALHILIAGVSSYLLLGQFMNWKLPLIVFASHALFDALKLFTSPRWIKDLTAFTIDQIAHIGTILALSLYASQIQNDTPWWENDNHWYLKLLILASGAIASTSAASIIIKKILPQMLRDDQTILQKSGGLPKAGHYIGCLERLLLFVFVMAGQLPAAGFLVAAKSIFRFSDLKADQQERSEYILVGTLLSFTTGILLSIFFKQLWQQLV